MRWLIEVCGLGVDSLSKRGESALCVAAAEGDVRTLALLIRAG